MPSSLIEISPSRLLNHFKWPILITTVGVAISIFLFIISIQIEMKSLKKEFIENSSYTSVLIEEYITNIEKTLEYAAFLIKNDQLNEGKDYLHYLYQNNLIPGYSIYHKDNTTPIIKEGVSKSFSLYTDIQLDRDKSHYLYDSTTNNVFYFTRITNTTKDDIDIYVAIDINQYINSLLEESQKSLYVYSDNTLLFVVKNSSDKNLLNFFYEGMNKKEIVERLAPYHITFSLNRPKWDLLYVAGKEYLYGDSWITSWLILIFFLGITFFISYDVFKSATENIRIKRKADLLTHEIKKNEEKYRSIIDNTTDGIITINTDGIIESYNYSCETIFGYSQEEVVGKNINILMPEHIAKHHNSYLIKHLKTGETNIIGKPRELMGRKKNGTDFNVALSVSRMTVDNEIYFSGIIRDITEQKNNQEALERSYKELQNFGYVLAHDLKAPIRSINGFVDLLRKKMQTLNDEKTERHFAFIDNAAKDMSDLIDTLTEYTKITANKIEYTVVDMNDALLSAKNNLYSTIQETQATINGEELPSVYGNKPQLIQLLQNIIGNSIKYCRGRNPIIDITASRFEDRWQFCIRDNGIGFNNQYSQSIFEPFKRLHSASEFKGTGLGLATCKKIIDRHQGTIWCESEEGVGTSFFFTLSSQT